MFPIEEYKHAAELLRARLKALRSDLKEETDPEKAFWLKRRIHELTPMLTHTNELIWLMEHFYEPGDADRDERYGFNGKMKRKKIKKVTKKSIKAQGTLRI